MRNAWMSGVVAMAMATGAWAQVNVSVRVVDQTGSNPLAGFNVTMTDNTAGASSSAATDGNGNAQFQVSSQASITCAIQGQAPYVGVQFSRQLGAKATFAIAVCILKPRDVGRSQVAQWRTGYNDPNQEPGAHNVRFAFHVKYYRDHSALAGMQIQITNPANTADPASNQTLTTDGNGNAVAQLPDQTAYQVSVTDPNGAYQPYSTNLHPGQTGTSRSVNILMRQ